MAAEPQLVLASGSPRRLELLRLAGLTPRVQPADIDESPRTGEQPEAYVARLAHQKATALPRTAATVVLAADTAVILDGELLGKPCDEVDAVTMLRRLQGRSHLVSTGVSVVAADGRSRDAVVTTQVVMAPLREETIAAYVATGEPMDKAGAYGIQGRAAAFVARIEGSWTNVVGLPLVETLDLLRAAGISPA